MDAAIAGLMLTATCTLVASVKIVLTIRSDYRRIPPTVTPFLTPISARIPVPFNQISFIIFHTFDFHSLTLGNSDNRYIANARITRRST